MALASHINKLAQATPEPLARSLMPARLSLVYACLFAAGLDARFQHVVGYGPASNPLELLMVVIFLFLLADTAINKYHPNAVVSSAWRANRFVVMFAMWAMFAAVVGVAFYPQSLFVFRNLLPAFLFFAIAAHAVRSSRDAWLILVVFVVSAVPNVALAVSQLVFGKPYPIPLNLASSVKMDVDGSFVKIAVSGLFNHPNALAVYLVPVFLASFGLVFSRIKLAGWIRLGLLLMLAASAVLLYSTKAKGAWLWGAFGIFVLIWPRALVRSRYSGWLMWLAVVALITATVTASLIQGGVLSTMMTRVLLWQSAFVAMMAEPFVAVFGSGQEVVWYASAQVADLQYANAHNVFLNQAVYFGIPGALLYIGCFVYALRAAHQAYRSSIDAEERRVAHICMAVICAVAGQYFFEPAAESSGLAVEVFLFMALSGCLRWQRAS
ncbi:MAG: O-antigen ligase family protein [Burkholderiales bacterium]|nr:O-antigen ligase family protein [Burkholderiales bacterium]